MGGNVFHLCVVCLISFREDWKCEHHVGHTALIVMMDYDLRFQF